MKAIHPSYNAAVVVCSCGNQFHTRSTQSHLDVEICSVCHPFYSGKSKVMDQAGRIERFRARQRMAA